jgi:hypothetical protein
VYDCARTILTHIRVHLQCPTTAAAAAAFLSSSTAQGAYDRARTILKRNEGELHALLTPYAPAAAASPPLSFAAGCI